MKKLARLRLYNMFLTFLTSLFIMNQIKYIDLFSGEKSLAFGNLNIAIVLYQLLVYGIPILVYFTINDYIERKYLEDKNDENKVGIKEFINIKTIFIAIIISIVLVFVMFIFRNFITNLLFGALKFIPEEFYEYFNNELVQNNTTIQLLIYTVSIVIITPVMEELFFRGVIIGSYSTYSRKLSVIFSIFVFSIAHHSFMQRIYVIPLSFVCGYLLLKTKKIIYSIIVHAFVNFTSLFNIRLDKVIFTPEYPIKYDEGYTALINSLFCFVFLIALFVILYYLINKLTIYDKDGCHDVEDKTESIPKKSLIDLLLYALACIIYGFVIVRFNHHT